MTSEKPRRRWFRPRYSLATPLVVVTAVSVWLGWSMHQVRQRELAIKFITSHGGMVLPGGVTRPWKSLPWIWSMLGAEPVQYINITDPNTFENDDLQYLRPLFPEAVILPPYHPASQ